MMQRNARSQSAVEFTIIVAVVIIIGVIAVALVRPSVGSGVEANDRASNMALKSGDIGVLAYIVNPNGTVLTLINNYGSAVSITEISFDSVICDSSRVPSNLGPNQKKEFTCTNINNSNVGEYYEYNIRVNMTDLQTTVSTIGLDGTLSGITTSDPSATGTPPSPPSLGSCDELGSTGANAGLFSSGSGNQSDPYWVCNCTMLQNVSVNRSLGLNYTLAQNIDCDESPFNVGLGFNPIGNSTTSFSGTFNGSDYMISNLFINRSSVSRVGLFGDATNDSALLTRIQLVDANITGNQYVGGLVGYSGDANGAAAISHISLTGNVSGYNFVGGIIGILSVPAGTIFLTNISMSGIVDASDGYVGGLIGQGDNANISDSYATANVTGGSRVGGLIGYGTDGYPITINHSYTYGNVTGSVYIGGMVGYAEAQIDNSYVSGDVYETSFDTAVGGILGKSFSGSSIYNSNFTGNIFAITSYAVGGIVGFDAAAADLTIDNIKVTGSIAGYRYVGGIVGSKSSDNLYITDTNMSGTLTCTNLYCGGLVGVSSATNTFTTSYWTNASSSAHACVGDGSGNTTGTNPSGCTAS